MSYSSGFSQGLNSVNSIWRTMNQKEYQDNQLGLREADQALREREYNQNDQFRRDSLDQQKALHDDTLSQQKLFHDDDMGLRGQQLQIEQNNSNNAAGYRQAMLNMSQRREQLTELQPFAQEAVQIVNGGGTLPPTLLDKLNGTPFDPQLVTSQPYKEAISGLINDINGDRNKWNSPENIQRASTILAPELNANAGQVDPHNGKTIKDSVFSRFIPSPDGKFIAPEVKVNYTDGSTETGPLSKFRTAHPDDPLIAIPTDKATQQIWARYAYSSLLSQDPNLKAVAQAKKPKDDDLLKEMDQLDAEDVKQKAKATSSFLPTAKDPAGQQKELQNKLDAIDKQFAQAKDQVMRNHGKPLLSATTIGGDAQRQGVVSDPDFPAFRLAMAQNKWDVDKLPTDQLTDKFSQFKQYLKQNSQATNSANQMRQSYQHDQ